MAKENRPQELRLLGQLFCGLALMLVTAGTALAQEYREGVHYFKITDAPPVDDCTIEVIEVFSYACPHCDTFEPYVDAWHHKLPDDVAFRRIPAIFRPNWEPSARGYYTAQAMGVLEKSHQAMFDAIHRERRPLRDMNELGLFYEQFGVSREDFVATSQSFDIATKLRRSQSDMRKYGVTGTPALIIADKYRIQAGGQAQVSYEDMLKISDFLIAKERQEREAARATDTADAAVGQ